MNNFKFIAHSMALGAVFAGLSTQALAQGIACGDPVNCAIDQTGPFTQSPASDSTGPIEPAQMPAVFPVSVAQFDAAAAAAMHGDATEGDIDLKRAEVTLELRVNSFTATQQNTSSEPPTDCLYDLQYQVDLQILANATVGTGELAAPPIVFNIAPIIIAPGETLVRTLADFAGNEIPVSSCTAEDSLAGDLTPWIGNGDITWELQVVGVSEQTNCPQGLSGVTSTVEGTVRVRYTYCVEGDEPPPLTGCECLTPSPNYRRPGSLLLFPEFDNFEGSYTVITVTNTDCIQNSGEDVLIEYVYIDADGCSEFNKTETLTPCDTLSVVTSTHNPGQEQGFLYVFAKQPDPDAPNGTAITWNNLIGSQMIIQGLDTGFDYSMNPVVFRGLTAEGTSSDLDGDGIRDLDNAEYEPLPDVITIPRFLGQDGTPGNPGEFNSQLILIGLTGGARFETTACFTFYNDNEVVFSGEYTWECWDKPYLLDISAAFGNDFLQTTDHDLNEIFGENSREAGWMCVQGCAANSSQESINDPAIYAALVEHLGAAGVADLPWECGFRTNGALLPRGVFGDPDEDTNRDGVVNEDDAVDGDNQ